MAKGLISVFEELAQHKSVRGFPCSVATFLKEITPQEQAAFNELLANKKIGTIVIYETLRRNKYEVGKHALYSHRKKSCRCFE